MTSNRFFIKKAKIHSSHISLDGDEHHHLSNVARIKTKEKIWLFDENGTDYLARVENIGKDSTQLFILKKEQKKEPKVKIILGQALIKTKQMELILQKSTELGIATFFPVITSRSVIRIEDKIDKKTERWKKIVLEAAKQCNRSRVPEVFPPQPLKSLLEKRLESKKLFLDERGGNYLRDILRDESLRLPSSVIILNGPEGGWTDEEEQDILNSGFEAINLGELILRAETAAISSIAMISHFWNL